MRSATARRLAVGLALAAGLMLLFFRGMDWSALGAALRSAHPLYLAGVALATLLTYALRAWRWGYLLAPLARVPYLRLLSVTFVGFMTGLLVPRAQEVVRPYLVARQHALRTSAAFASIILERLVDLITVLILFGAYLYVLPMPSAQTRGPLLGTLKVGGALAGLLALAALALLFALHAQAERAVSIIGRLLRPLPGRVSAVVVGALRSFAEGLAVLQASPRHLLVILGQSFLVWLSIALTFQWNNKAFGLELPFHASFLLIGFLTVGVAVPTPGTVGGFHEAYLLALTQAYGIDKGTAAAAGITGHALSNLPVLLLGLLFLGREGLSLGRIAQIAEKTGDETEPPAAALSPEARKA